VFGHNYGCAELTPFSRLADRERVCEGRRSRSRFTELRTEMLQPGAVSTK